MRTHLIILLAANAARGVAADPAEARWDGTVRIPGNELHVVVDLAKSGGQWTGSAIVPGYAVKGAPLTGIVVQGSEITFTLKGALGEPRFNGSIHADGTFTGDFLQLGNTAAFRLVKTGPPQVDAPRQSTAVSKELEGEWQGALLLNGNQLTATLKLANQPSGAATAQFMVVGKRENNLPVELVRQEGDWLLLDVPAYRITFEGRFRGDAKELTGTFAQGPTETQLVFHRVAK